LKTAGGKRVLVVRTCRCGTRLSAAAWAPLKVSQLFVEVAYFGSIRCQARWRDFESFLVIGR
jgi:hypothetical protein